MSTFITTRRVDRAVTGFLADVGQDESVFRADTLPTIQVTSKDFSGILFSLPLAMYTGDATHVGTGKLKRPAGATYPRPFGTYDAVQTTYECEERAGADSIDDVTAERMDDVFDAIEQRATPLRRTILLDNEIEKFGTSGVVFNTANWPNVAVGALPGGGGAQWSAAGSTPVADGLAMQEAIRTAVGVYGDLGYMTHDVLDALRTHQQTLRLSGTLAQGLASSEIAVSDDEVIAFYRAKWRLRELYVVEALYNSANPGAALSLTEMRGGCVWFGCSSAARQARPARGGAMLGRGPTSFAILQEKGMRGYLWRTDDPPATHFAAAHSWDVAYPSTMASTAYLLTGVV